MGGFQFSPAAGAEMLMKGLDQELVARQQALDAIMYPLGARNGPGGGTPGSGSPTSMDNILRTILSGKTPAGMSASQVGSIIAQLPNQIRNFLMLGPNGAPGLEEIYGNVRGGDWTSWYNPDQGGGYTFPGPGMEEEYGIGQGGDWGYIWNMPDFSYDDFINSLTGSGE